MDLGPNGPKGIALALVARAERNDGVRACGYLVDTFCLGVKNVIGPQRLRRRDLSSFIRTYFKAFPAPAMPVPLELAQHLVLGAVDYAARLGFPPHRDFEAARGHLGILERCAISFGRNGRPLYIAGPYDDPRAVMAALRRQLGADGFWTQPERERCPGRWYGAWTASASAEQIPEVGSRNLEAAKAGAGSKSCRSGHDGGPRRDVPRFVTSGDGDEHAILSHTYNPLAVGRQGSTVWPAATAL